MDLVEANKNVETRDKVSLLFVFLIFALPSCGSSFQAISPPPEVTPGRVCKNWVLDRVVFPEHLEDAPIQFKENQLKFFEYWGHLNLTCDGNYILPDPITDPNEGSFWEIDENNKLVVVRGTYVRPDAEGIYPYQAPSFLTLTVIKLTNTELVGSFRGKKGYIVIYKSQVK